MDIKLTIENEYIPKAFGNQDKKHDQIIVVWRYPNASERNSFRTQYIDTNGDLKVKLDYDRIIETCVIEVKNLKVNGEKVTTGKQLNETPAIGIIADEISSEILIKMNEVNLKNF